jgi:type VI secretion system protein ImpA
VSKDLQVAARLTEALARLHGFAGLRDGLRLLADLTDQAWDRLRPVIEDGDVEVRAGPFYWLDDPDHGARLPVTVRNLPLVFRKEATQEFAYGRLHWDSQSKDPRTRVPREDFEKAILTTPLDRCEQVAQHIAQSRGELDRLRQGLAAKMGPAAPGLSALQQALDDCHGLIQQILQRKRPVSTPEADIPSGGQAAQAQAGPAGVPTSRAEAYRQLARAAAVLQELEPHSPIPYLVQRAVELGSMPFPQLMKALIRDANVLGELNRELGIKDGANAPSEEKS